MQALATLFSILIAFFSLSFLVNWYRYRRPVRKFIKYGLIAWILEICGLILVILLSGIATYLSGSALRLICSGAVSIFTRIAIIVVGMYYCQLLCLPSFPLILRWIKMRLPPEEEPRIPASERAAPAEELPADGVDTPPELPAVQPTSDRAFRPLPPGYVDPVGYPHPLPPVNMLPEVDRKDYWLAIAKTSVIGVMYTVILFTVFKPEVGNIMREVWNIDPTTISYQVTAWQLLAVCLVAFGEELLFRLGIQNFLAWHFKWTGNRYWIAIASASAIWTLGHTGALDPIWVKWAQIFPIGLLLGWMFKKYGAESTILTHMVFNILLAFAAPHLMG